MKHTLAALFTLWLTFACLSFAQAPTPARESRGTPGGGNDPAPRPPESSPARTSPRSAESMLPPPLETPAKAEPSPGLGTRGPVGTLPSQAGSDPVAAFPSPTRSMGAGYPDFTGRKSPGEDRENDGVRPSPPWVSLLVLILSLAATLICFLLVRRRLNRLEARPDARAPLPPDPVLHPWIARVDSDVKRLAADLDAVRLEVRKARTGAPDAFPAQIRSIQDRLANLESLLEQARKALLEEASQRRDLQDALPAAYLDRQDFERFQQDWALLEKDVMDKLNERVKTPRWSELMRYVRDESQQNAARCVDLLGTLEAAITGEGPTRDLATIVNEAKGIHQRITDLNRMKQQQRQIRQSPPEKPARDRIQQARDVQNLLLLAQNEQILSEILDFPRQWVRNRFLKAADPFLRAYANGDSGSAADEKAFECVKAILAQAGLEPVMPAPGNPFDPRVHVGRASESDPRYNDQVVLSVIVCGLRSLETQEMTRPPEVVVNRLGGVAGER